MPWIFLSLMLMNAVYFGWNFMEGSQPQARTLVAEAVQVGDRVQLLSEKPRLAPVAGTAPDPAEEKAASEPAVAATGPQCFNVGSFAPANKDLQRFVSAMRGKNYFVRVDQRRVDAKDYWVFVPAFTNREKAEERLSELKSRGVDGFVVKEGVFINSISLNHFSRKELAQAYLEKMQAIGIGVEYREIARNEMEHWVYLAPARSKANLRQAIDAQLTIQNGLRRENASCEE